MKLAFAILLVVVVLTAANYCPVLRSHGELSGLFHGYPSSMLLPSVLVEHARSKFRNCTSRNHAQLNDMVELCSADTSLCAVTKQNIQTAMSVADWPQYAEALRRLETAIKEDKPHVVNVFVFGGSMTKGAGTFSACICQNTSESTCPSLPGPMQETDCNWPTMLSRWLKRTVASSANIKINLHNLAQSAITSRLMADNAADYMHRFANTFTFTADDLVFVDHSVNDLSALTVDRQLGFESLIRRLLSMTGDGARPTIIAMEQMPLANALEKKIRGLQGDDDYASTYREVCRHYGVILWSLREVFWTHLDFTTVGAINSTTPVVGQVVIDGVQHVRMYPKPVNDDFHPPWWRHLFIADVLADCMLRVMTLVTSSTARSLYTHSSADKYVIPAPLRDVSALSQGLCDSSKPFLVDAHAVSTFTPPDLLAFETNVPVVSKVGWREYIDYHDTPGFTINSLSNHSLNHLTFPLVEKEEYFEQVIKIMYLKSYSGMGVVGVKLCGDFVLRLDGLYHDHETFKFSMPTMSVFQIRKSDSEKCARLPAQDRTVQVVYLSGQDDHFAAVRQQHHHKFKLLSVQVCTPVEKT